MQSQTTYTIKGVTPQPQTVSPRIGFFVDTSTAASFSTFQRTFVPDRLAGGIDAEDATFAFDVASTDSFQTFTLQNNVTELVRLWFYNEVYIGPSAAQRTVHNGTVLDSVRLSITNSTKYFFRFSAVNYAGVSASLTYSFSVTNLSPKVCSLLPGVS